MAESRNRPYHEQVDIENTVRLRQLISQLPPFVREFFRGIEQTTSSRTRIAYAYDLRIFFHYLMENYQEFAEIGLDNLTPAHLEQLKPADLEQYMEYLKYYHKDEEEHLNQNRGIMRKISSLKAFYNYFYRREVITYNPAALVDLPKDHEKPIIRLDADEIALLLDHVEQGDHLTKQQKNFHEKTRTRDLAILTLLLGTGIRVSECVGVDLKDLDFKNDGLKIHRKGGKEVILYFGDEVEEALLNYLDERTAIVPCEGHEDALFLSLQRKRISVRSVEKLVKKYTQSVTALKHITPHKLRSTYGTQLYQETGDIYLVADVLGHSDVNTTRKHYAAIEDNKRRQARNKVRLRREEPQVIIETESDSSTENSR